MRGSRQVLGALRAATSGSPALPLLAAGLATLTWFAASNGGFDGTTWYPGALLVLGLVAVALVAVPWSMPPRLVLVALAAFALYAAWSYLSIAWADQKGDAWDGANRTALYLLLFALFALWRPRARVATLVLATLALAVAVVGLVELLRASSAANPSGFFLEGRFASPSGYQNANVALWSMAFLPCTALGARRELHPLARGILVAAAVLLGGLAILGQSRGWLFTAPFALIVFVAIVPGRIRTTLTLLLVAAALAAAGPSLLHVYDEAGLRGYSGAVSDAAGALIAAALIAGAIAAGAALADRRARPTASARRRGGIVLAGAASLAAVAALVVFVAKEGSPFHAISKGWHDFKSQQHPRGNGSRFNQSLGSGRYDFWRVSWHRFGGAPLQGIGADNFQEAYLKARHTDQEPRYPHSVELRTLSQTGLVGTIVLAGGMAAALAAGAVAIRRRRGLGSVTAAAAIASFAYWLLHGSVDWFWEFPALGGPAFALLGLAAGLMPRRPAARRLRRAPLALAPARVAAVLAIAVVPALSLAAPWVSQLESNSAAAVFGRHPQRAYNRLDAASSLNPLSANPKLIAGSIAVRLRQDAAAERYFRQALERDPGDVFSHLELGALLSQKGRRPEALAFLARAHALDPRDDIVAGVLRRVARGRRVNITAVNDAIAQRSVEQGR